MRKEAHAADDVQYSVKGSCWHVEHRAVFMVDGKTS
jgi:hypothetical protein